MGDLGYLGINFGEDYGGTNGDLWYSVVFLEEIARSTMGGFSTAVSVHQYMAINHIAKIGSSFLKEKYYIFAREFVYSTSWKFTQGEVTVKECLMAKLFTSELAKRVADGCLQFLGGFGYVEDYPIL